jgi:hypothetical protein
MGLSGFPKRFLQNALGFYGLHTLDCALWLAMLDFVHYVIELRALESKQVDQVYDFNKIIYN